MFAPLSILSSLQKKKSEFFPLLLKIGSQPPPPLSAGSSLPDVETVRVLPPSILHLHHCHMVLVPSALLYSIGVRAHSRKFGPLPPMLVVAPSSDKNPSSRINAMIYGKNANGKPQTIHHHSSCKYCTIAFRFSFFVESSAAIAKAQTHE